MNQVFELMCKPRRVTFARSLESMNPELAEMEELRRNAQELDPGTGSAPVRHRKLSAALAGMLVIGAVVLGKSWGGA